MSAFKRSKKNLKKCLEGVTHYIIKDIFRREWFRFDMSIARVKLVSVRLIVG